jgi:hypothetical protein
MDRAGKICGQVSRLCRVAAAAAEGMGHGVADLLGRIGKDAVESRVGELQFGITACL